jgi:hypothetical protein
MTGAKPAQILDELHQWLSQPEDGGRVNQARTWLWKLRPLLRTEGANLNLRSAMGFLCAEALDLEGAHQHAQAAYSLRRSADHPLRIANVVLLLTYLGEVDKAVEAGRELLDNIGSTPTAVPALENVRLAAFCAGDEDLLRRCETIEAGTTGTIAKDALLTLGQNGVAARFHKHQRYVNSLVKGRQFKFSAWVDQLDSVPPTLVLTFWVNATVRERMAIHRQLAAELPPVGEELQTAS